MKICQYSKFLRLQMNSKQRSQTKIQLKLARKHCRSGKAKICPSKYVQSSIIGTLIKFISDLSLVTIAKEQAKKEKKVKLE